MGEPVDEIDELEVLRSAIRKSNREIPSMAACAYAHGWRSDPANSLDPDELAAWDRAMNPESSRG